MRYQVRVLRLVKSSEPDEKGIRRVKGTYYQAFKGRTSSSNSVYWLNDAMEVSGLQGSVGDIVEIFTETGIIVLHEFINNNEARPIGRDFISNTESEGNELHGETEEETSR